MLVIPRWSGTATVAESWVACSTVVPWIACAKHNITGWRYLELLHAQDGVCAICGNGNFRLGEQVPLGIDHDHACCPGRFSCGQCVRGLHCSACGGFLGRLEYDGGPGPSMNPGPDWVERAMRYLAERGIDPSDKTRQRLLLEGHEARFLAGRAPLMARWLHRLHELRAEAGLLPPTSPDAIQR